jgi:hypothetical protein
MTVKEEVAKEALRLITKVLNDPRLQPDDGDQLRKAQRELVAVARSGKLERRRLFRAVKIISQILQRLL